MGLHGGTPRYVSSVLAVFFVNSVGRNHAISGFSGRNVVGALKKRTLDLETSTTKSSDRGLDSPSSTLPIENLPPETLKMTGLLLGVFGELR